MGTAHPSGASCGGAAAWALGWWEAPARRSRRASRPRATGWSRSRAPGGGPPEARRHAAVALCDRSAVERASAPGRASSSRRRRRGDRVDRRAEVAGAGAGHGGRLLAEVSAARVRLAGLRGGATGSRRACTCRAFGAWSTAGCARTTATCGSRCGATPARWRIESPRPRTCSRPSPRARVPRPHAQRRPGGRGPLPPAPVRRHGVARGRAGGRGPRRRRPRGPGGARRGRCRLLRNRGEGRFSDTGTVPCAADARGIAAADLDGDGLADLVCLRRGPGGVARGGGFGFRARRRRT